MKNKISSTRISTKTCRIHQYFLGFPKTFQNILVLRQSEIGLGAGQRFSRTRFTND